MKKPFLNNTDQMIYKGATLIRPGESRDVEEQYLQLPASEAAAAAVPQNTVEEIHGLSIGKAKARFVKLKVEELMALKSKEDKSHEPRKGMIDAITEELLAREAVDEDE